MVCFSLLGPVSLHVASCMWSLESLHGVCNITWVCVITCGLYVSSLMACPITCGLFHTCGLCHNILPVSLHAAFVIACCMCHYIWFVSSQVACVITCGLCHNILPVSLHVTTYYMWPVPLHVAYSSTCCMCHYMLYVSSTYDQCFYI